MWAVAILCVTVAIVGLGILNTYAYHCRGEQGCGRWFFAWSEEHAWQRYYRHVEECHDGIIR